MQSFCWIKDKRYHKRHLALTGATAVTVITGIFLLTVHFLWIKQQRIISKN